MWWGLSSSVKVCYRISSLTVYAKQSTVAVHFLELRTCMQPVSACTGEILNWKQSNRLQLNADKTELIWCDTPMRLSLYSRLLRLDSAPRSSLHLFVTSVSTSTSICWWESTLRRWLRAASLHFARLEAFGGIYSYSICDIKNLNSKCDHRWSHAVVFYFAKSILSSFLNHVF